jgi:hypothetical protein
VIQINSYLFERQETTITNKLSAAIFITSFSNFSYMELKVEYYAASLRFEICTVIISILWRSSDVQNEFLSVT